MEVFSLSFQTSHHYPSLLYFFYFNKYGDRLARNCGVPLGAESIPQLIASKEVLKPQRKESVNSQLAWKRTPSLR